MIIPIIIIIKNNERQLSTYECGYDSWGTNKNSFSLRFFMIILIFLIFDIEVILFYPLLRIINRLKLISFINTIIIFSFILITTLIEWFIGNLDWKQ